jgi:hypothetical protein
VLPNVMGVSLEGLIRRDTIFGVLGGGSAREGLRPMVPQLLGMLIELVKAKGISTVYPHTVCMGCHS